MGEAEKGADEKCEKEVHPHSLLESKSSFEKMNNFFLRLVKELTVEIFTKIVKILTRETNLRLARGFIE